MDFLDPKRKRAYNIRLAIGFVLITIALILGTTILALITAGYGFDTKTGKVIQNGLVFINSQPVSADVYINGSSTKNATTNARLELPAGNYGFVLKQSGYHDWSTTTTVFGGSVEEFNYPFLFPVNPISRSVDNLPTEPAIATSTPDRHWLLVSVPGQSGVFHVIDLTNVKTPITTVTIPSSVLTNQPGTNTYTVVKWSTDNQHLLLQDNYQGGSSFIMFDWANPAASFNISQMFNTQTISSVRLDNNAYDKLYLYNANDKSLVLADATAKTVTAVLSNVDSYWPYSSNDIVYATVDPKQPTVAEAMLWDGSTSYELKDLPVGTSYQLNMASYNGDLYVIVGSSSSDYAYIYKNPLNSLKSNPGTLPLPDTLLVSSGTPQNVTFSDSARYIALQSGSQFAVYDLETQTHYRYDTGLTLLPGEIANWMDGNRLTFVSQGKLVIFDFDGTNLVNLVPASNDFLPSFSQSYDAVYTMTPIPNSPTGQWEVVRNSLIANKS